MLSHSGMTQETEQDINTARDTRDTTIPENSPER